MIAQTTHRVCGCLRETIDDAGHILGEMAKGNLVVDVTVNESYYIGDFKALSISLQSIHAIWRVSSAIFLKWPDR